MKVFVTGAIGFVGQHMCDMLLSCGHQVTGMDIRQRDNIQVMTGPDLSHEDIAIRAVEHAKPDVVIHLASSVSTAGSIERPMETFTNTVRTAVNMLEACRVHSVPMILTSSVKARDGLTPYGASKQMVETWAREYINAYGVKCIINRPGTIYGPGQEGSAESGWIAWFLKAKREGLPVVLNAPGTQIRDLLHVTDYCRLMLMQLTRFERYVGTTWDVGGGWPNAVVVQWMANTLGLEWSLGPARYGDAEEYVGFNDVPGWEPQIRWKDADVFKEVLDG